MRTLTLALALLCGSVLGSCAAPPAPSQPAAAPAPARPHPAPACSLELAESWPVETSLDHPAIRDARDVWPEMMGKARRSIDVAEFYVSASGTGALEPTLAALQAAAARGVRVRVLLDSKLASQYAASIDRLRAMAGLQVTVWDAEAALGGVLHAKYLVMDREQVFVGSQNLDDRSLEHIEELGIGGACPAISTGRRRSPSCTAACACPPARAGSCAPAAEISSASACSLTWA